MLPEIRLDQENFEEIVEEGRSMISAIYPQWTDYNYSDPGITILEMFAWLKEMQQFSMDQVTDAQRMKFLKLLGQRPRMAVPARTMVELKGERELLLKKGTRFYAGSVCFETETQERCPAGTIRFCKSLSRQGEERLDGRELVFGNKIRFAPFGEEPCKGDRFVIGLSGPLEKGAVYHLTLMIYDDYPVKRSPISSPLTAPLAKTRLEVWDGEDWRPARMAKDETCGLLTDGRIAFWTEQEMAYGNMYGEEGYFLSLVLEEEDYDIPPVLTGVSLNYVPLVQKETFADAAKVTAFRDQDGELTAKIPAEEGDCLEVYWLREDRWIPAAVTDIREEGTGSVVLNLKGEIPAGASGPEILAVRRREKTEALMRFTGTGFPDQTFSLGVENVLEKDFRVLAEDPEQTGTFREWLRTEDFDALGPEDCCYVLDSRRGLLLFGDGDHGRPPEGEIRLAGLSITRGKAGNVKSGQLRAPAAASDHIELDSFMDAEDGLDSESIEECFQRFREEGKRPRRAVSAQDYEELVRRTPGLMIQSCRVLEPMERDQGEGSRNGVEIVVRPYSIQGAGKLSQPYRENILAYLEPRRLLGTEVVIHSPEYVEVTLYAEVKIRHQYPDAREQVERAVRTYFGELEDTFGQPIIRGRLYGRLDSLECVEEISALVIEARGNRIFRSKGGDVFLPPNGAVILRDVRCGVVNG